MEEYELIGLMLGVAIFNSIIVDLKMPMVWKPSTLHLLFLLHTSLFFIPLASSTLTLTLTPTPTLYSFLYSFTS